MGEGHAGEHEYERFWRVVPVSTLPFPFHLFRCPFEKRHRRALEIAGADPDDYETPEQCSSAFRIFMTELGAEVTTCPYHVPDWMLAAERAIEAVVRDPFAPGAGIQTHDLDEQTAWAAWEFFAEPIFVDGARLGNGQHRVCAMKCAGVPAAPIEDYQPRRSRERGSLRRPGHVRELQSSCEKSASTPGSDLRTD